MLCDPEREIKLSIIVSEFLSVRWKLYYIISQCCSHCEISKNKYDNTFTNLSLVRCSFYVYVGLLLV